MIKHVYQEDKSFKVLLERAQVAEVGEWVGP